jgi:hypothetical protein
MVIYCPGIKENVSFKLSGTENNIDTEFAVSLRTS